MKQNKDIPQEETKLTQRYDNTKETTGITSQMNRKWMYMQKVWSVQKMKEETNLRHNKRKNKRKLKQQKLKQRNLTKTQKQKSARNNKQTNKELLKYARAKLTREVTELFQTIIDCETPSSRKTSRNIFELKKDEGDYR